MWARGQRTAAAKARGAQDCVEEAGAASGRRTSLRAVLLSWGPLTKGLAWRWSYSGCTGAMGDGGGQGGAWGGGAGKPAEGRKGAMADLAGLGGTRELEPRFQMAAL